jgi:tetratricopeptide (TPR) repeat protein
MKPLVVLCTAAALLALTTCGVTHIQQESAERRSAQWQRVQDGRAYSEFLRGRYAALTNDPVQAANFYAAAAKNEPYDKDLLERATFTSLIAGDVSTAILTAQNAPAEARNGTALPKLVLAVDAIADGRSGRAATLLEQDTNSRFNNLIAHSLRAWAIYDTLGLEAGLSELGNSPENLSLIVGLTGVTKGMMELHAGDKTAALATFEGMWEEGFRLASTTEMQARLLAATGQHDKAIDVLTNFSTTVGQNAAIEATRRALLDGQTPAIEDYTIRHGSAVSVYTAAAALAAQTNSDLAGVYFALALHLDNDLHVARTLWANALDDADRREEAIAMLQEVPESSVFYSTARGQLAWALRREGRDYEALQTATEALETTADRNLKIQLGDLFRSLGDLEQAEQVFSEIIEGDDANDLKDWRLYYARGAIREQLDDWENAERDLLTALDLAPRRPALLNYLGYSWIDRGEQLERSLEMIQTAVKLRPNAGFIVDSLGWAYYRLGQYDKAVEQLERAVYLSPSDATLNDHLGDAYWQVGRRTEAKFQWERVLRIDPDYEDAKIVQSKINDGITSSIAPPEQTTSP